MGQVPYDLAMKLSLTENELSTIAATQTHLLTERLDDTMRVRRILSSLQQLVGAARAFAIYPLGSKLSFVEIGVGTQIEDYLGEVFRGFDQDGNALMSDCELEEINRRRRQMGAGVHHENRLKGRRLIENTRFFREAFEPAGMHHVIGMTCPLPVGEAVFAFGFLGDDDPGFKGTRTVDLLRLVLPAFQQGFGQTFDRAVNEAALDQAFKAWPGSRIVTDPAQDGTSGPAFPGPALPGAATSWIIFESVPTLDTASIVRTAKKFGLTARQTQVMEMMLKGLSSIEIAEQLDISSHTARRHCEAVLSRLKLRSRAAIWTALA
jgi:DNA-binding CsgD family transcriptional regulator